MAIKRIVDGTDFNNFDSFQTVRHTGAHSCDFQLLPLTMVVLQQP